MPLTKRQLQVATLLGEGIGPYEIAKRLGLTESAVKMRLRVIYKKTGIQNDPSKQLHVLLGIYMNCELFQIGLRPAA
jgi:DNA-binding NarL/FixJ family response regulator